MSFPGQVKWRDQLHEIPGGLAPGAGSSEFPDWLQLFEEGPPGDAPISENVEVRECFKKKEVVYPPPVLAEVSKRLRSSKPTSKHDLVTHFIEESNCEVSKWTKIIGAHCQNQLLVRINLGFEEVFPADKKNLLKGICSTCTHWRYKSCTPIGFRVICENKKCSGNDGTFATIPSSR